MRETPEFKTSARHALMGKCPCCGKGKLFRAYLKQVDNCSECGEYFGAIRADDAAPWLTIIIVGHVFLPIVMAMIAIDTLPVWASCTVCVAILIALSLVILPRAKALFI